LLGAALRLSGSGWRVAILGAATPAAAIGQAVRSMSPRLVGLSVTRPPKQAKSLFKQYAKAIGNTPWVVGGPAAADVEEAVVAAGGQIAAPPGAAWNQQMREWSRGR
jgi:hypothetical protein